MLYLRTLFSILEVLAVTVPVLLSVAYVTIAERKTMASMQRRLGPDTVGWYGLLQAFADALKLLLKEYVSPTQANMFLFFLGPIITLIFSLLGFAVIPYGPGLMLMDYNLGILYLLAMSSLATYGILLAGWSANSKYAFLGSLRSTAQLISYELILSSAILIVVLLAGSLDISVIIEAQRAIWYIIPLFPVFIVFFIGSIAETNRAPFDLAEAESELVSGFMTEHSAVIFVFFFLAEYGSLVLICIFNSILFLGAYLFDFNHFLYPYLHLLQFIQADSYMYLTDYASNFNVIDFDNYPSIIGITIGGVVIGLKSCSMIFTFIWARASFPRIRYDQLMSDCWTILLPVVIALIILVPCIVYDFEIIPANVSLLSIPFVVNKNTFALQGRAIFDSYNSEAVIQLLSDYLRMFKDSIATEEDLKKNPPHPHSFVNILLLSTNLKGRVTMFDKRIEKAPNHDDFKGKMPEAIRNKADKYLENLDKRAETLHEDIEKDKNEGKLSLADADDMRERVADTKESIKKIVQESANTAMESRFGDGSDTEDYIFKELPILILPPFSFGTCITLLIHIMRHRIFFLSLFYLYKRFIYSTLVISILLALYFFIV